MTFKKTTSARTDPDEPYHSYGLQRVVRNLSAADAGRLHQGAVCFDFAAPVVIASLEERDIPFPWLPRPEAQAIRVRLPYEVAYAAVEWRWEVVLPSGTRYEPSVATSTNPRTLTTTASMSVAEWEIDLTEVHNAAAPEFMLVGVPMSATASATTATLSVTGFTRHYVRTSTSPLATFNTLDGCLVEAVDGSGTTLFSGAAVVQSTRMTASPNEINVWPGFDGRTIEAFTQAIVTDAPATVRLTRYGTITIYGLTVEELHQQEVTGYSASDPVRSYPPRLGAFLWSDPDAVAGAYSPGVPTTAGGARLLYGAGEHLFRTRAPLLHWGPTPSGTTSPATTPSESLRAWKVATVRGGSALTTWVNLGTAIVPDDDEGDYRDDSTTRQRRALEVIPYILGFANSERDALFDLRVRRIDDSNLTLETKTYEGVVGSGLFQPSGSFWRAAHVLERNAYLQDETNLQSVFERIERESLDAPILNVDATHAAGTQYITVDIRPSANGLRTAEFTTGARVFTFYCLGLVVRGSRLGAWQSIGS